MLANSLSQIYKIAIPVLFTVRSGWNFDRRFTVYGFSFWMLGLSIGGLRLRKQSCTVAVF